MSGCDNSNIRKNYIVSGVEIDILSACTGFYTDNIYNCSGDTLTLHSDNVSANTINSSVYLSGGTNLLDIFDSFDNFTTASTLIGNVAYFDRTNALSAYTLDLSTLVDNNTFVTGFTYDNSNNLSIIRNDNISIGVNISQFSGLTINGGLSATTLSACTGIYTSNLYGCSPINVNDNLVILSGITLSSITNNNLLTQILVRDSINGAVEYRDVGTIISASSANTFVTAFTYDNINTFTISDNSGNTFNSTIDILSATTISATTYYGDGSNLSGISTDNFYVSGGTYDTVSKNVNFSGNSIETTFSVDLTSLVSSVSGDTFVNGGNANVTTSELTFSNNTGGTFTVTNSAALFSDNDINVTGGTYNPSNGCVTFVTNSGTTFDVCGFVTGITDTFVTGGTYNDSTDIITFTNTSGNTFNVTGITDSYTTGSTINGTTIQFDNNLLGLNYYNVDLLPLLSGKTNNTTFNTYTSDTQTIINTKISGATNLSTTGIFGQKNGQNLEFKGITSTGGTVTITNDSNSVNLDVIIPPDTNTFVTGFTYNDVNTFTINDNAGSAFTASINVLSATTISATTFYGDGSNLSGISTDNFYVSGGTYNVGSQRIDFSGNNIVTTFDVDLSSLISSVSGDTFVTGQTFNNSTYQLTTTLNDASNLVSDLSILSTDMVVTGGTYDINTGIVTFTNNSGGTFNVSGFTSGMTDSFTTTATTSGTEIQFNSNLYGSNFYNVDLTPIISAKTDVTLFNSHTADTSNPHQTAFSALTTTAHTHTLSEITDFNSYSGSVDTILNSKVEGGFNVGDGEGIFRDKTGTTLNFRTIKSTGSTVEVSTVGDIINLEVTQIPDTNTFVTGFTYDGVNSHTINLNNGSAYTTTITTLSASSITATTFYGDGSNLTGLVTTDNYVSGGTYNTGTTAIDFVGTNTATTFSVNVSDLIDDTNTFVTGGTFTSGGTLELEKNNGINVLPIDFTSTKRLVINSDQSLAISAGRAYLSNTGVSLLSFDNSPPSVDDEASFNFNVPSDYVSGGTFYLQITSLGSTPPNNEIQFEMDITSINVGGDLSTTTDSALQNVTSASTTNWELVESPPYTPSSATFTQNKNVSVKINRDVSDVADTYNDTAYVWGLVFEYVGIR